MASQCSADTVYPFALPTPLPVGSVYVYLIKSDPVTLIDSGINLPDCRHALEMRLKECRLTPADVRRVIVPRAR